MLRLLRPDNLTKHVNIEHQTSQVVSSSHYSTKVLCIYTVFRLSETDFQERKQATSRKTNPNQKFIRSAYDPSDSAALKPTRPEATKIDSIFTTASTQFPAGPVTIHRMFSGAREGSPDPPERTRYQHPAIHNWALPVAHWQVGPSASLRLCDAHRSCILRK